MTSPRTTVDRLERKLGPATRCPYCGGGPRFVVISQTGDRAPPIERCACGGARVVTVAAGFAGTVDRDRPPPVRELVQPDVVGRVSLGFVPREWQFTVVAGRRRFTIAVCHRRAGKTALALVCMLAEALQEWRPAPHYAYVAPQLNQARRTAWGALKAAAQRLPGTRVSEGDLAVTLANGAVLRLLGGDDPDALRGLAFDGVVVDELASMKPELLDEVVFPALTDRCGWLLAIGTPKGMDRFATTYFNALSDPAWAAFRFDVTQTSSLPAAEVALMRASMDPNAFEREFMCSFDASGADQLISMELAREASKRVVAERQLSVSAKVIGVDVARFGDDRTVICRRWGRAMLQPIVLRGADTMAVASHVALAIQEFAPDAVFIDDGGVGGGVTDRLRQLGFHVVPINFGAAARDAKYANLRAQMWFDLRDWLRDGGALVDSEELLRDLTAPRYEYRDGNDKIALEKKADIKRRGLPSPDLGDALALTFAMPVAPGLGGSRYALGQRQRPVHDYNSTDALTGYRRNGVRHDYHPFRSSRP